MSSPWAACGPVQAFAVVKVSYLGLMTTCPSDNLGCDIFGAGGPYYHIITSVTNCS